MSKIINITHTDLDGIGCPIVLKCFYKAIENIEIEPIYCDYHNVETNTSKVLDRIEAGEDIEKVFITDISFREESKLDERIEKLNNSKGRTMVQLFDHHATSGYLNKYEWAWSHEIDATSGKKKCGTQWTYDFLLGVFTQLNRLPNSKIQESLKNFVTLVNLWDTWRWVDDSPEEPCTAAQDLNMIYSLEGKPMFMERYLNIIQNGEKMIGYEEQMLLQCKRQEIEKDIHTKECELVKLSFCYKTKRSQLDFIKKYLESNHMDKPHLLNPRYHKNFKVGAVYLDRNISDVGNALAANHPELDFIMIVSMPKTVSFRSVKDLDVPLGIIANNITGKGGGHPKSAGGVLPHNLKYGLLEKITNKM